MWTQTAVLACGLWIASGTAPPCSAMEGSIMHASPIMSSDKAEGTISAIDMDAKSFTLQTKNGDVVVRTSDKTVFSLDGKDSTMAAALKAGRKATVEHKDRTAIRVDVTSA